MTRPIVRSAFFLFTVILTACWTPAPVAHDSGASDGTTSDGVASDGAHDATIEPGLDAPAEPPTIVAIAPAIGSVAGGTTVTIDGSGFSATAAVTIGGVPCKPVTLLSAAQLTCTTGDTAFLEGAKDVVVATPGGSATLAAGFTYQCPWLTSSGSRSCGAVPPRVHVAAQVVASWLTQFSPTAVVETDGAGTPATLSRTGLGPFDFTNHVPKLWVKVENVKSATTLQLVLGDSNFANQFRFSFHSTQGQRWTTDGDWVALTMSWSPANVTVVGTPNRAAITDVQLRVIDNATGTPVRVHLDGIALVREPVQTYPDGVLSITFDDNFATMVSAGLPVLAAHAFPATAYVIVDLVGAPGRASLAELHTLQSTHGWEIAAHAYADAHHAARFPNLAAQVVEDDLVAARAWLIANDFTGYDHCAYPGGDFTGTTGTDVLAIARTYFATCRTIYQGERETYPPADAAKLRVFYVTNTVTLAQVKTAVDQARANREWIILVFHALVATPSSSTQWSSADFAALATHIAATGIPVKTIGQVVATQ